MSLREDLIKEARKHIGSHLWMIGGVTNLDPEALKTGHHLTWKRPKPFTYSAYRQNIYTKAEFDTANDSAHSDEIGVQFDQEKRLRYKKSQPGSTNPFDELEAKRDFFSGYAMGDLDSQARFMTAKNVWLNCFDFVLLILRNVHAVNIFDLENLARLGNDMPNIIIKKIIGQSPQSDQPRIGDIALWAYDFPYRLVHIGIISDVMSNHNRFISLFSGGHGDTVIETNLSWPGETNMHKMFVDPIIFINIVKNINPQTERV